jgi:hypothetical protein
MKRPEMRVKAFLKSAIGPKGFVIDISSDDSLIEIPFSHLRTILSRYHQILGVLEVDGSEAEKE